MHPLVFYFPPFVTRRASASRALVLAVTGRGLFRRAFGGAPHKSKPSLVVTMLLVLYVVVGTASFVVGKTVTLLWDLTCRMQPVRCV